jgi:hypothetical protein
MGAIRGDSCADSFYYGETVCNYASRLISKGTYVQASRPLLFGIARCYSAGPNQDLDNPIGAVAWQYSGGNLPRASTTRCTAKMAVRRGLTMTLLRAASKASGRGSSAAICLGRFADRGRMTPRRAGGGDNPPYRTPVFVLTNHPRPSLTMSGGTTFHFVTDGVQSALDRAVDAANGQDIRLGEGIDTPSLGYQLTGHTPTPTATHMILTKRK